MEKILGASILGLEHKANKINELIKSGVNWIHYDIMDGHFVKNNSLPDQEIEFILNHTEKHIKDLHLMVLDPMKYFEKFHKHVEYISFHYEAESIERINKIIKTYGHKVKIGLAISPKTNIEQIYEFIPDIAFILVMSVIPGLGGQKFMPEALEKIKRLRDYCDKINPSCFIQVDGGINDQTGPEAIKAGATALVSGSYLLSNLADKDIKKKILG